MKSTAQRAADALERIASLLASDAEDVTLTDMLLAEIAILLVGIRAELEKR